MMNRKLEIKSCVSNSPRSLVQYSKLQILQFKACFRQTIFTLDSQAMQLNLNLNCKIKKNILPTQTVVK